MKKYEKAARKFLESWEKREDTLGAMICGSYVTGRANPGSDIDVYIVLDESSKFRERGNLILDGFLIEYFCNPPQSIRKYFEEENKSGKPHTATMLSTGIVAFSKDGSLEMLVDEAIDWLQKPVSPIDSTQLEFIKYHIWDMTDNLRKLYAQKKPSFVFSYHCFLSRLLNDYSLFLGYSLFSEDQWWGVLTEETERTKYLKSDFPDGFFPRKHP